MLHQAPENTFLKAGGRVASTLKDVISSTTYSNYMHWKYLLVVLQRPLSLMDHSSVISKRIFPFIPF